MAHKLKDTPRTYQTSSSKMRQGNEVNKPEETAAALDALSDPFAKLKEAADACGFPQSTVKALVRRMETKYKPVDDEIKALKTPQLLHLIEEKIGMCLEHMDDYTFANAELRDLAVTFGILAEKRQLLRGEPTQILSVNERVNMNELLPQIIKEAGRRGMTIDATPTQIEHEAGVDTRVLPREGLDAKDISRTAARLARKMSDKL